MEKHVLKIGNGRMFRGLLDRSQENGPDGAVAPENQKRGKLTRKLMKKKKHKEGRGKHGWGAAQ